MRVKPTNHLFPVVEARVDVVVSNITCFISEELRNVRQSGRNNRDNVQRRYTMN